MFTKTVKGLKMREMAGFMMTTHNLCFVYLKKSRRYAGLKGSHGILLHGVLSSAVICRIKKKFNWQLALT